MEMESQSKEAREEEWRNGTLTMVPNHCKYHLYTFSTNREWVFEPWCKLVIQSSFRPVLSRTIVQLFCCRHDSRRGKTSYLLAPAGNLFGRNGLKGSKVGARIRTEVCPWGWKRGNWEYLWDQFRILEVLTKTMVVSSLEISEISTPRVRKPQ